MILVGYGNSIGIRVILSGLTACGKSTHATLLADRYGVRHHAMRSIMRAVAAEAPSGGGPNSAEWSPEMDARRARDEWIDRESDRRMVEAIASGEGVFDAWALPWLYAGADAVRVWIEADLASRVERCLLSYEMRSEAPPADPAGLIEEKDEFSRRQFRRLYGIELGPDPAVFDVIVENSTPMSVRSPAKAAADAAVFSELLQARIESALDASAPAGR